jgi:uncharacterized protein YggU (UPF0235/DUF167 family)
MGIEPGIIYDKISLLVMRKKIVLNPHRLVKSKYSEEEETLLIKRYNELVAAGKGNEEIFDILSLEFSKKRKKVAFKLWKLAKRKKIPVNTNSEVIVRFTKEEVEKIRLCREALMPEGHDDKKISEIIATELGFRASMVIARIYRMAGRRKWPKNSHNRSANKTTAEEAQKITALRNELIPEKLNEKQIAQRIADKLGKKLDVVYSWLRRMIHLGKLPVNPYAPFRPSRNGTANISTLISAIEQYGEKDAGTIDTYAEHSVKNDAEKK